MEAFLNFLDVETVHGFFLLALFQSFLKLLYFEYNMNLVAYIIYLVLTYIITVNVGLSLYRNGRLYILGLMNGDEKQTDFINRMLLLGYYLLNLGYATVMIGLWEKIDSVEMLVSSIVVMIGRILLSLASIHYGNMLMIYILSKYTKKSITKTL